MPLTAQGIGEASVTASRLVLLLPSQFRFGASAAPVTGQAGTQMPQWAMVALITGAFAMGLAVSAMHAPASQAPAVAVDQTVQHDR